MDATEVKAGGGGGAFATIPRSPPPPADPSRGVALATRKELSDFLASVERRAFKQGVYAVHNEEAALDIVQDAMLRLSEKYSDRPPAELPLLFQRILQNAIRDYFRRSKVRSTWTTLLSSMGLGGRGRRCGSPGDAGGRPTYANVPASPADRLEQSQVMALIERGGGGICRIVNARLSCCVTGRNST